MAAAHAVCGSSVWPADQRSRYPRQKSAFGPHTWRVSDDRVLGWVWPSNVRPFLTHAASYIGYEFDDSDWMAVETALAQTDADNPDTFYEYPLVGRPELVVQLAQNVGAAPVDVVVTGPMDAVLKARVETLLSVLADVEDTRRE
jgi:hypothetical protein